MGTPDFAVPALNALHDAGHEIAAVYSQPPRRAGRGKQLRPTPVHARAEELGIAVRTPVSLKDADAQAEWAALNIDVAVVAAYGLILPQAILDAPRYGCINIHASLLPRWRGAAPVQRAILAGDAETGVTIMQMAAGLDTGPMLAKRTTQIDVKTAGELTDELAVMGAEMIVETLGSTLPGAPDEQDDALATYAKKIDKAEARIDLTQDAAAVERQVRAFNPMPGAFFEVGGERYKLLAAEIAQGSGYAGSVLDDALTIACGSGAIRPVMVQRAGKPAMATADLLRGKPIPAGTQLN